MAAELNLVQWYMTAYTQISIPLLTLPFYLSTAISSLRKVRKKESLRFVVVWSGFTNITLCLKSKLCSCTVSLLILLQTPSLWCIALLIHLSGSHGGVYFRTYVLVRAPSSVFLSLSSGLVTHFHINIFHQNFLSYILCFIFCCFSDISVLKL